MEYSFMGLGSIRAGQSYIYLEPEYTSEEMKNQFTIGAGLNYKIPRGPRIQLDYVIRNFGVLQSVGGYSLNISF
jgi:hypothetical protein